MTQLSEDERRRLFRLATGSPAPRPPAERREPVEQFQVEIKASTPAGRPVPSPVGPFPSREVAATWWEMYGTQLVDPYEVAEVTIRPMYLSWRP